MNKKWHILFCDEIKEICPVTEFINTCEPKHQVKVLRILSLLEEQGPTLPRPYADVLHHGIHGLRFNLSRNKVRVLYFFCYQKFIVLYYVFFKNTQKVPEKYISKVIRYRNDFLNKISQDQIEENHHAVF